MKRNLLLFAVTLALVLSGCGQAGGETPSAQPTVRPSAPVTPVPTSVVAAVSPGIDSGGGNQRAHPRVGDPGAHPSLHSRSGSPACARTHPDAHARPHPGDDGRARPGAALPPRR